MAIASERTQMALDTILHKPTKGIPTWQVFLMELAHIERLAGAEPDSYRKYPEETYVAMQNAIGTCALDQYIPHNPLSLGEHGYENAAHGATTGASDIVVDGMVINSPETVVEHMEKFVFPRLKEATKSFDEDLRVQQILDMERGIQAKLGPDILKTGYGFIGFPCFDYGTYGYVNYFSAYALYPDVMEKHFSLQADLMLLNNKAAARAYNEGNLPPVYRLDHDMADSRGTLVRVESLDEIWFPHFVRCLEPMLKTDVQMIWHCDGNLMDMVPRLLDCGIRGFQGFQYEDGMDYENICKMKTRDGENLIIFAGVSVTRTLPMGKPSDIKREIDWLVEYGPKTGLFLGASSSVVPGVAWRNIETLVEGLAYYRENGRC